MRESSSKISPEKARIKIYRYCSYQERSHSEVKQKLFSFGLGSSEVDLIISELITAGFLNEERFAKAFAGGKFRLKKWGRIKIQNELEFKGLTKNCIRSGMAEIEESEYLKTLEQLLGKKALTVDEENEFIRREKLAKYAVQKGFEPELVWRVIKENKF